MPDETLSADPARVNVLELALAFLRDGTLSIDAEGRIWRHKDAGRPIPPRRAENVAAKGYLRLTLGIPGSGRVRSVMAHRVVWAWLKGPIPARLQVNHKDLDKANNRPGNLELVTGSGNIRHSYDHGRPLPYSKKDPADWVGGYGRETREVAIAMRGEGRTLREIAAATGMSVTHAHRITGSRRVVGRISPRRKAEALRLWADGWTQSRIVEATGISLTHLQRLIRKAKGA
jgi:hypothetical protein